MNRQKTTATIAAGAVLAGVAGLTALALPSQAGAAPVLPPISAPQLVQSVLTAKPPAFGGTVEATNNTGLAIPGLLNQYRADVFSDGTGKFRMTAESSGKRTTTVKNNEALWTYTSNDRKVVKATLGAHAEKQRTPKTQTDPAEFAKNMINEIGKYSTVRVDGTAEVADRDAYELVLTPKPTEKTLLREVRVAVDSQTRMPLRAEAFGNGSADPALSAGFTKLTVGAQDASLFDFTPPQGAKVETVRPGEHAKSEDEKSFMAGAPKVVGDGWDTVLTGKIDPQLITKNNQLVDRIAKPVSGPYGKGKIVRTSIATALVTDDGRVAAGFVPEQVLAAALKK